MNDIKARFARLEPLIDRALELEGAERGRFVALCGEIYPDLAADLGRALAEDDDLPALGGLAAEVTRERTINRSGLRVGPWRLCERIGQGGMGAVYLAERADGAFEKRVAIKLLRAEDARFREALERERQLLARLDHPGIARLIDGGVLADGQPWLAMELVEGQDFDVWLETMPPLERRLEVFLSICEAVSHAHAAQVVHRDLKPRNIRICAQGRVKLLDFGIGKLLTPRADGRGTRHQAVTPGFAAPEQLVGRAATEQVDVYALGALLFLLLAGRTPQPRFDGNWVAFIEQVTGVDPPLASEVLAASGGSGGAGAAVLRGDLDAIAAMALQRDPARRYASVTALAQDLRRYLGHHPVVARAPGWRYRSAKWLRRHRLAAALAALWLAIGAAVVGVLWLMR